MPEERERVRGLSSVADARAARARGRFPSPKFWGWAALILAATGILHWKWSQGQVESARQALLARQRAAVVEFGARWFPIRDKIEGWTIELARDPGAEVVATEALKGWDFRDKAGIYLRMRVEDAKDAAAIRKAAKDSLRDAFTSCLMRVPNVDPLAGKDCKKTRDCSQGEFCNEADHCARPAQPYNLRVAYRTLYVLSDEWMRDVQDASTELRIRLLSTSFDDTARDDFPLAADLLTRAQYFLLVLDETPQGAPDGGAEAVQALTHTARVGVWRLSDGATLLRIRREAGGQLLGAQPAVSQDVLDARQRQANSCALALAVRSTMGDSGAAAVP